jgi:hypothetical protein
VLGQQAGNGRLGHPEGTGHVGRFLFLAVHQLDDKRLLFLAQFGRPSAPASLGAGVFQTLLSPFSDHGALELGEAAQHLGQHPAGGGAGFDVFREALEGRPGRLDLLQDSDKVLEGPAEAVELPDGEDVALAELVEEAVQLGTVPPTPGGLFLEDLLAARLREGVDLGLDFLRVAAGHTGVADAHNAFKNCLPYPLIMQVVFESVKLGLFGGAGESSKNGRLCNCADT